MRNHTDVDNVFCIKTLYTAFSEKYESSYYYGGETHNFWEMVFVVDGEIGVTAGSEVFILKKGQAIIHEPMEFHSLWSESGTKPRIVIFTFTAENMPEYSSKIFEINDIDMPDRVLGSIKSAFEMNFYEVIAIKNAGVEYQLAVKELEMFVLRTLSQKLGKRNTVNSRTAKNYALIVNFLNNNVDKNLSVEEIAKMCNMSEVNLKKTFSKYAGKGVMCYFNSLKVTAAIAMLQNGMSVKETALALGFANQNYFSTVFKRITGNSPTFYK